MSNGTTSTPRVGLCFLCIDNLHPLMTLSFQNEFFQTHFHPILHPKYYEKVNHHLKPYCVPRERILRTGWGHISLVEATLVLLREALKVSPPLDYFILLSETHMPIMPWNELWERIRSEYETGKGRMNVHRGSIDRWSMLRKPPYIPKQFFWKHSQWISMTREMAEFFVEPSRVYTNQYLSCVAPDEHYFTNVLVKEKIPIDKHFYNRETCYVRFYTGNNHPIAFTSVSPQSIQLMKSNNYWFVRKILPSTKIPQEFIKSILNPVEKPNFPIINEPVLKIIDNGNDDDNDDDNNNDEESPNTYENSDLTNFSPESDELDENITFCEEESNLDLTINNQEFDDKSENQMLEEETYLRNSLKEDELILDEYQEEKKESKTQDEPFIPFYNTNSWYFQARPQISLEVAQRNNLMIHKPIERNQEVSPTNSTNKKEPKKENIVKIKKNTPRTMRKQTGMY